MLATATLSAGAMSAGSPAEASPTARAAGALSAPADEGGAGHLHVALDTWHDSLSTFDLNGDGDTYAFGQVGALRLRLGGDVELGKGLTFHGELDAYAGRTYGDPTELGTDRVEAPFRDAVRFQRLPILPRRFSLSWASPVGVVELGHTTSHWGLGLLANSGQRDGRLFADPQRGNLVERLSFATAPLIGLSDDPNSYAQRLTMAVAGDLVFADAQAELLDEDLNHKDTAWQGIFALFLRPPSEQGERPRHALSGGGYVVYRDQEYADGDTLQALIFDGHVRYVQRLGASSQLRYELETAWIQGETNRLVTELGTEGVDVESSGTAFELAWSSMVSGLPFELVGLAGTASGDGDPDDGVLNRFTFHADYDAGMILFAHVIPALQRQAVSEVDDPLRTAEPPEGLESLPGWGGISGASYGGLRLVVGPWRDLELGLQYIAATTTAPLTDPYASFSAGGSPTNPFGGNGSGSLGQEFNVAARYAFELPVLDGLAGQFRLTYGAFLPGEVLEGPEGKMGTVHLAQAALSFDCDCVGGDR